MKIARMDDCDILEQAGDSNKNADARQRKQGEAQQRAKITMLGWDDTAQQYEWETRSSDHRAAAFYLDQFQRTGQRQAADREHSFQHGFAIDEDGISFGSAVDARGTAIGEQMPWVAIGVQPGGPGWKQQMEELFDAQLRPPQLRICSADHHTDISLLTFLRQVTRVPTASQCRGPAFEMQGFFQALAASSTFRPCLGREAQAKRALNEAGHPEPSQRHPRSLELYSGRGPLSKALQDHRWNVKFLDNDPKWVAESLTPKGALDPADYINLDFLDFAVGFFLGA
eukprot:6938838-Prymnesium_polylepis.1